MTGKEKCAELKKIRKEMADKLGIDLHQKECTYKGECKGTCPKCLQEELILNSALLKKKAIVGGTVALTALSLSACTPIDTDISGLVEQNHFEKETVVQLMGDVAFPIEKENENSTIDSSSLINNPDIEGGIESPIEDENMPAPDILSGDVAVTPEDIEKFIE